MYTKSKQLLSVEGVFIIIVLVTSILNITNFSGILSILVSLIGIIGGILFFVGKNFYVKLIYVWIIAQVIAVRPLFDFTQFFNFGFSFTIGTSGGDYELFINIVAIIFLSIYKLLLAAIIVNRNITFEEFRESDLGDIFPLSGTVSSNLKVGNEPGWFLINLDGYFDYERSKVQQVLVKRKDEKTLKLNAKDQLVYFRLVLDDSDLQDLSDKSKFPFVEWVYCK